METFRGDGFKFGTCRSPGSAYARLRFSLFLWKISVSPAGCCSRTSNELDRPPKMSAAYKSVLHNGDDSDIEMTSSGNDSSRTLEKGTSSDDLDDSSDTPSPPKSDLNSLPVELRNRVLLLTSRGVSHRLVEPEA